VPVAPDVAAWAPRVPWGGGDDTDEPGAAAPGDNACPRRRAASVAPVLGLPDQIRACLFDLDGVLTRTASLHMAAWKRTFDEFLRSRDPQAPEFTLTDYHQHVDGKPRADGVRDFLASRGILLPEGSPDDPPGAASVQAIATRKNDLIQVELAEHGVEVFPGSVRYLHACKDAGLAIAVVTASANGEKVIAAGGFAPLIDARIDGVLAKRRGLRGKPEPDTFLAGAEALGVGPRAAVVFEDALAGVAAGRAGGFGYVVGVDRAGQAEALRERGADVVVSDLEQLLDGRT
jgi:beta-phosphoglucomutase family hydrolase